MKKLKKKLIKSLSFTLGGSILLATTITAVSCSTPSKKPNLDDNNGQQQEISFKENLNPNSLDLNALQPTQTLASKINDDQVLKCLFKNKDSFLENVPSDFATFSNLVSVHILNTNDQLGSLNVLVSLKNQQQEIALTGFKKQTVSEKPNQPVVPHNPIQPAPNPILPNQPDNEQLAPSVPEAPTIPELPSEQDSGVSVPPISPQPTPNLPSNSVVPNEYNAVEGIDYFVKPGSDKTNSENWITLPTTKNQSVLNKWGNVPLPWKTDDKITTEDIIFMFDTLASGTYITQRNNPLTFGPRNIETNFFATGYAKWMTSNWINYPYYLFANGTFGFEIKYSHDIRNPDLSTPYPNSAGLQKEWFNKSNNPDLELANKLINSNKHYVKELFNTGFGGYSATYLKDVMHPSDEQQTFINFFIYFLSQIRPGMNDFDKLMVAEAMVLSWFKYVNGGGASILWNAAVCADYSTWLAFLLNLVGIPAMPMVSNYLKPVYQSQHEIVWVYLDPKNGNNKQWYGADMTFLDTAMSINGDTQSSQPVSIGARNPFYSYNKSNFESKILFSTSESQFKWNTDTTFTNSSFWYMPWSEPYKDNSKIGTVNLSGYNYDQTVADHSAPNSFFVNTRFDNKPLKPIPGVNNWNEERMYSKFAFNDGYWYWMSSTRDSYDSSQVTQYDNYFLRCKSGGSTDDIELVNVPKDYEYLLHDNNNVFPMLQSWNDRMIFLNRKNKTIVVVPFKQGGIDWDKSQSFNLNTSKNLDGIIDFCLDLNGNLKVLSLTPEVKHVSDSLWFGSTWSTAKYTTQFDLQIPEDAQKAIFGYDASHYLTNHDVEIAYKFFHLLGGLYKVGNQNYETSSSEKQAYYESLDKLLKTVNTSSTSQQCLNAVLGMKKEYEKFLDHVFKVSNNPLLASGKLNNSYYLTPDTYDKYGFTAFNSFKGLTQPEDFATSYSSDALRYDVYFNKSRTSNLTEFFKTASKVISNSHSPKLTKNILENPYGYYYVVVYPYKHPEKYLLSNQIQIIKTDDQGKELLSGNLKMVGDGAIRSNYNPNDSTWAQKYVTLYFDWNLPWNSQYKINYIDLDNPKVIKTIQSGSSIYNKMINIGNIDNNNHGLYWIEVTTSDNVVEYSPFVYLLTQNDANHFNSQSWLNAINTAFKNK